MTDRELMQQALEALDGVEALLTSMDVTHLLIYGEVDNAITALRERLAQPEQEPVAWIDEFGNVFPLGAQRGPKHLNEPMKPLYTTPPQRKPLTHPQIHEFDWPDGVSFEDILLFVRAIEAAHDIKGQE